MHLFLIGEFMNKSFIWFGDYNYLFLGDGYLKILKKRMKMVIVKVRCVLLTLTPN